MTGTLDPLSRSHRAARVESEEAFGARLRRLIMGADVRFVDVARTLGITTNDLTAALDGAKHVRAAWLELLPPAVELAYLADRAAHHAMRLAPAAGSEATMRDVIAHLGTVLSQCGASEADGFVAPEEAAADLRAIRDLQRRLEELTAHRERALAERGLSVINGARR